MSKDDTEMQDMKKNAEDEPTDKTLIKEEEAVKEDDSSSTRGEFTGLTKEEVLQFANDPKWKKIRLVLFILFWVVWCGMFVIAIVIIITSEKCPKKPDLQWWQKGGGVYEVAVPSFYDSDKDGVGDIKGVSEKLGYLRQLSASGITLWLSGITQTNADFTKATNPTSMLYMPTKNMISSKVGTSDDLKDFIAKCNERKQALKPKVIVDLFPLWNGIPLGDVNDETIQRFVQKAADSAKNDECKGIPAVKTTDFCESDLLGYSKKVKGVMVSDDCMPMLDLTQDEMRKKVLDSVDYWTKLGVNGFVVHGAEFLHMPFAAAGKPCDAVKFMKDLREKAGSGRVLLAHSSSAEKAAWLYNSSVIDMVALQLEPWEKVEDCCNAQIVDRLVGWLLALKKEKSGNYITSFGLQVADKNGKRATDLTKYPFTLQALGLLASTTPFTLYGEELGLESGTEFTNTSVSGGGDAMKSLTLMPWSQDRKGGFTKNPDFSWMPVAENYLDVNVKASEATGNKSPLLKNVRGLMALRDEPAFQYGAFEVLKRVGSVFAFSRTPSALPRMVVVINFGPNIYTVDFSDKEKVIPREGKVVFSTSLKTGDMVNFNQLFTKPGDVSVFEVARKEPE